MATKMPMGYDSSRASGLESANPDKGFNTPTSSSMGVSSEYGVSGSYRGNEYENLYEKVQKSDARKLKANMKSHGYRA